MKIAVICFTRKGYGIMEKINKLSGIQEGVLSDYEFMFFCKCNMLKGKCKYSYVEQPVEQWTKEQFQEKNVLLFIGAVGIAVRAIASFVKSKLSDSPVIVMDDGGRFVIPVLSGHVGGGNKIAGVLANAVGATAVITTATDVHQKFAVDVFAKENNLYITKKEGIAKVSAKVLEGEKIRIMVPSKEAVDWESYKNFQKKHPQEVEIVFEKESNAIKNRPDVWIGKHKKNNIDALLYLKPKEYIVGIGCKKGTSEVEIRTFVMLCLKDVGITLDQVLCIASIDCKKEEEGIIKFAQKEGILFQTFSSEVLLAQQGKFHESEFVRHQVGVGNVCERAAIAACHEKGQLVVPKQAKNGVTIAIAKRQWRVVFDEK